MAFENAERPRNGHGSTRPLSGSSPGGLVAEAWFPLRAPYIRGLATLPFCSLCCERKEGRRCRRPSLHLSSCVGPALGRSKASSWENGVVDLWTPGFQSLVMSPAVTTSRLAGCFLHAPILTVERRVHGRVKLTGPNCTTAA